MNSLIDLCGSLSTLCHQQQQVKKKKKKGCSSVTVLLQRDIVLLVHHNMCLCMSAGYLKTNEGEWNPPFAFLLLSLLQIHCSQLSFLRVSAHHHGVSDVALTVDCPSEAHIRYMSSLSRHCRPECFAPRLNMNLCGCWFTQRGVSVVLQSFTQRTAVSHCVDDRSGSTSVTHDLKLQPFVVIVCVCMCSDGFCSYLQ